MLREIRNPRQIEGEPRRRWFDAQDMDLILWYGDDGQPMGFQLSYTDPGGVKKLLTWYTGRGYSHSSIDEGEGRPFRYKMSPIEVPDGVMNLSYVVDLFTHQSRELESSIRILILERLRDYPA
jgi:hypothetical protein